MFKSKKYWPIYVISFLTISLFTFPNKVQGRWSFVSDGFFNEILVCQDGIHFGLATDYELESLEFDFTLSFDPPYQFVGNKTVEISYIPILAEFVEADGYYWGGFDTIFWSEPLSPGTEVYSFFTADYTITVQDCELDDRLIANPYPNIPTISIEHVESGEFVTIRTQNYPRNQLFTVTMGPMYTRGINGEVVGAFNSEGGGQLIKTFIIPESLRDAHMISIRAQTNHRHPYYSFNYFINQSQVLESEPESSPTSEPEQSPSPDPTLGPVTLPYSGIPTFTICSVERNQTVTIQSNNFPPNQTFKVLMGPLYARGGYVIDEFDSGVGGSFARTFDIPFTLQDAYRIAIWLQTSHQSPYYAYNWFYNNTASVCD